MPEIILLPPRRRPELLLRPLGDRGRYVVKDPRAESYFQLGEQEHFLLDRLDGYQTADEVRKAFEDRFGEKLSEKDFEGFLDLARGQGFLTEKDDPAPPPVAPVRPPGQSILYWRKSLIDPDRLLDRWAPRLGFLWTRTFLAVSLLAIVAAAVVVSANWDDMVSRFAGAWRWETALLVWLTLLAATTLHEFAHGLTCKHYGGEVHEIGFLMMFFLPCLYCNVSDAWLFKEKSKRLLVTFAGGYCDLCLWALAVFAWRLTPPEGLPNYVAWVVLTVVGGRVFFNFNPLLKLDGYYMLSDWAEVPNLFWRGHDRVKAHLRRLLWGAAPPPADPHGRFLTAYGLASWVYGLMFLGLMLAALYHYVGPRWGLVGLAGVTALGVYAFRGLFIGLVQGEVRQMILKRRRRTVVWGALACGAAVALPVPVGDRAGGPFRVRSATRTEVRATAAGFLREVPFAEADRVPPGAVVARLEVPDLERRIARGQAEADEARAKLALLEAGPKPAELAELRRRVEQATRWRDLGQQELDRSRAVLREDLTRLGQRVVECEAELNLAKALRERVRDTRAASIAEVAVAEAKVEVCQAQLDQARTQRQARKVQGAAEAEVELGKRSKELADAVGALAVLEAGPRPEEVAAARAAVARAAEGVRELEDLRQRLVVRVVVGGVVTTPRVREKVGRYLQEGELICEIEEPAELEVEVTLDETAAARVRPGQEVELRVRAYPFESPRGRVVRVAPAARPELDRTDAIPRPDAPGSVTAYCVLEGSAPELHPGMTGYARVRCDARPVGVLAAERALRWLRTEFWW
ncbi:MAG TPA: HlyD family efflux transporter periplasmic adaptor subunit [Fimbriiglobus sp.]|nr:HlyD family efflux transporter periplasmic adaptor subunit [Fimbriiglobus sp.]